MIKFSVYDKAKAYTTQGGVLYDYERVLKDFPAAAMMDFAVGTDESGECIHIMQPLSSLYQAHNIPHGTPVEDLFRQLEEVINNPEEEEAAPPSDTERLAAAQEYQNLQAYGHASLGVVAMNAVSGLWSPSMVQESLGLLAAELSDEDALLFQPYVRSWQAALEAGESFVKDEPFEHESQLYRAVVDFTPEAHRIPGSEGLLAIMRPVNRMNAGTREDPIPFLAGMDVEKDKYYSNGGVVYLAKDNLPACHAGWAPGTDGMWQWEVAE